MEPPEPLARPLLSGGIDGANARLGSPAQEMPMAPLPSASASATSSNGFKPLQNPRQVKRPLQFRHRMTHAMTAIGADWKSCARACQRIWASSWTLETCSYGLSILALAGLVATLFTHQNKPLPQWPQMVTINSIMSLFSLLMRACVGVVLAEGISQWRLDSASRGSWGSLTLLYHFRPRQAYYLAALGAIITIMASLTGFFSQQLVQFRDCFEKDTAAVVSISRSNTYAQSGGSLENNVPVDFAPMIAAIHVGVIQPVEDLTNVLASGCISGNCSFPATDGASFSTLAVSHLCQDITTHIRTVNESTNLGSRNATMGYLALDYGNNSVVEWPREQGGLVLKSWTSNEVDSVALMHSYFIFRSSWRDNYDWRAVNCSLSPTINTYAANINDGILKESVIERIPLRLIRSQFPYHLSVRDDDFGSELFSWPAKMATNYTIRNGRREPCEGSENPATDHIKFMKPILDSTYINSTNETSTSAWWKWWYYPKDCLWSMHRFSMMAMIDTLAGIFDDQEAIMGNRQGVEASPQMRQIYLDGNMTFATVNERIEHLATSMTSVIRVNGGYGNITSPDSAKGDVWIKTTCMSIRWPWITFPVVMIGLTGIFLLLVVFENRGIEQDRLWKSLFLAALFCDVEIRGKPVGKAEMMELAESTSVSLTGKNRGELRLIAR